MTQEDRIQIAAHIISDELVVGKIYSISADEMIDRSSITEQHLRKICEFGLKVLSGDLMPRFDKYVEFWLSKKNERR